MLKIKRLEEGRCNVCGDLLHADSKFKRCEPCRINARQRVYKYKVKAQQNGLCFNCGKPPITKGKQPVCEVCYLKRTAKRYLGSKQRWTELRDLWEKQKGLCAYTKTSMILGLNSSIDHIYSSSRYPEKACDINNMEWVNIKINIMKKDMSKPEFLNLLRNIVANTSDN